MASQHHLPYATGEFRKPQSASEAHMDWLVRLSGKGTRDSTRLSVAVGSGCLTMATLQVRLEHDLLGDKEVPAGAYYGVQTLRALENFEISGVPLCHYPELVQ